MHFSLGENDLKVKKSETKSGKSENLDSDDFPGEIQSKGQLLKNYYFGVMKNMKVYITVKSKVLC